MAMTIAGGAQAQLPLGQVALDLSGQGLVAGYHQYTTTFTAQTVKSTVTFIFRNDPGYFAFDNASVMDITNPSGELLVNGGFEALVTSPGVDPNGQMAPGWTLYQQPGVTNLGGVYNAASMNGIVTGGPLGGQGGSSQFWGDGSTNAYDGIAQSFTSQAGDTYQVSFWLDWSVDAGSTPTAFDSTSINAAVYAPDPIPEPASLALFGAGVAALGLVRRRRRG